MTQLLESPSRAQGREIISTGLWFFSMNAVPKVGAAQWEPADRKEPRKAVWTYPFQGVGERKGDWNYGNGL